MQPGERLRAGRQLAGLTAAELAEQVGCHWSMVLHLEHGRRRPGRRLAIAIEDLTATWPGGPITARDWERVAVLCTA